MKIRTAVLLLAGFLFSAAVQAVPVSLTPEVDGYAEGPTWTTINDFPVLGVATTSGLPELRAALEFDLSAPVLAGVQITSAKLVLYAELLVAPPTISVQGYTGDGVLGAGDFSLSNEIATFTPVGFPAVTEIDVTSFVQGVHSAGSQYVGFQLRELLADELNLFTSSNDPALADRHPRLDIQYQPPSLPEPASVALVVLGVAGLGFARRISG